MKIERQRLAGGMAELVAIGWQWRRDSQWRWVCPWGVSGEMPKDQEPVLGVRRMCMRVLHTCVG
jgi:hypothetical protein